MSPLDAKDLNRESVRLKRNHDAPIPLYIASLKILLIIPIGTYLLMTSMGLRDKLLTKL